MKFPKVIKKQLGMTYYKLNQEMAKLGINVSHSMLSNYEKSNCKKMRLDVLLGYLIIGKTDPTAFIQMLKDEILPKA